MPDPKVSETPAEGAQRYLMLVCADMRRAMEQASVNHPAPPIDDPVPTGAEAAEGAGEDDIDRWISDAGPRRIYGWPLVFPDRAVTVRRVDGEVTVTDGPFAETKEQIAGFDLLECTDLDDAITVAAGHPVADGGSLELRPLWA
jgi:hypothetical protein